MAGIDQSDFGVLHHPQMTSTIKPTVIEREKSFEEERQEHMQNFKVSLLTHCPKYIICIF